jgi:hypothetical protein
LSKKRNYNKRINYDNITFDAAAGQRYVYFSSILNAPKQSPQYQLGLSAQKQLNSFKNKLLSNSGAEGEKSQGKIITALNFLRQAAEFERTKELQFF